jgi:hypothetical protein
MVLVNHGPFGLEDLLPNGPGACTNAICKRPQAASRSVKYRTPRVLFHLQRRAVGVSGAQTGEQPPAIMSCVPALQTCELMWPIAVVRGMNLWIYSERYGSYSPG